MRNPEFGRPARGVICRGIGDRNNSGLICYMPPGDQMMAAHHAGANKANAQRLVHGRSLPIIAGNQHARPIIVNNIATIDDWFGAKLPPNIKY